MDVKAHNVAETDQPSLGTSPRDLENKPILPQGRDTSTSENEHVQKRVLRHHKNNDVSPSD